VVSKTQGAQIKEIAPPKDEKLQVPSLPAAGGKPALPNAMNFQ